MQSSASESSSDLARVLDDLNMLFTIIFAIELLLNLYANWFRPFFSSSWNILDLIVVVLSLASLGPIDLPMNILRMMRVFRVIRLFGRIKALKKMIAACIASVIPMANAFLIMTILASICERSPRAKPLLTAQRAPLPRAGIPPSQPTNCGARGGRLDPGGVVVR